VYVEGPDGTSYRVYDVIFMEGRHRPTSSAQATGRLFRPGSGWWRLYRFRPGDPRTTAPDLLQAQLRSSEYLQRGAIDVSDRTPR
jgi:hypothetical protein